MPAIAQEMESSIVEQESYTRKWWKKSTDTMAHICNSLVRRDGLGQAINPEPQGWLTVKEAASNSI